MSFLPHLVEKTWRLFIPIASRLSFEKPIFIIGCPRSGTSIFVKLFSYHKDLANWSEAGRVWDPNRYDDPLADHVWTADDVNESDMVRLKTMFMYYQLIAGKKRFVNKHPRNSVRVAYIKKIFPDCKFIHILRDGRAVAGSLLRRSINEADRQNIPFGNFCKPPNWQAYTSLSPIEQVTHQWREIVEYTRNSLKHLPRGDVLELKYENFCEQVHEHLKLVDEFCELSGTRQWQTIPNQLEMNNMNYQTTLSSEQITVVESICGDLLNELGYRSWLTR